MSKNEIPSRHLEIYNRKTYAELSESADLPAMFYIKVKGTLETRTIVIPMTYLDGTINSAHSFIVEFFRTRGNHLLPIYDDAVDYLNGLLIESFNKFCKEIESKFDRSFDDILYWTRKWRDVSTDIIKDSFEKYPLYHNKEDRYDSNFGILKQSINIIHQLYSEHLAELNFGPLSQVSDVVLYNFWGDSVTANQVNQDSLLCPSDLDLKTTNRVMNCIVFAENISPIIDLSCGKLSERNDAASKMQNAIVSLFRDYIKRINMKIAFDPEVLAFVTDYWKEITKGIIANEIYIKIHSLTFENVERSFFKRKPAFVMRSHVKFLEGLYALSDRYLAFACDLYKNEHLAKYLNHAWSKELKAFNLDYRALYKAMSGTYFDAVTYEQFKFCFESADMSLLQRKCKVGKYGGIRYMIVKLRSDLPIWYEKVADTLTDSNGKKYDKITLQRSVFDDKVYAKEFRKMIKSIDIDFPK